MQIVNVHLTSFFGEHLRNAAAGSFAASAKAQVDVVFESWPPVSAMICSSPYFGW
jgi:hypothetical protein